MAIKNPKFKFTIKKLSESDIYIDGYKLTNDGGSHYMHHHILLSPQSIPKIVEILGDKERYYKEYIDERFKNDTDELHVHAQGSDMNPVITIFGKHKLNENEIEKGIIFIPYHPVDSELILEYIGPFLEALQKYCE